MELDFKKGDGLIPAIIQDYRNNQVLMLGYMNEEALELTERSGKVTFYSRSKKRLWTKGESSGHYLIVQDIRPDCDNDALLIRAIPKGPVCHTGEYSCFRNSPTDGFLRQLEQIIIRRRKNNSPDSYTVKLFNKGRKKIAQKVGEEATEMIIEAIDGDRDAFIEESADLMYHILVLLKDMEVPLVEIESILHQRHKP